MPAPVTGRPRVLSAKCETCVFHPGNRMHLREGRLQDLVRENLDAGALLTCHSTLYREDVEEASCRGFLDAYGDRVNVVRVMERLAHALGLDEWYEEVDPPPPDH